MRLRPLPPPLRRLRNRLHAALWGGRARPITTIAWLSVARSGTTYVCDLLHSHPQIEAYPEIFHPHSVFSHEHEKLAELLRTRGRGSFASQDDPALIAYAHEHPRQFLGDLRSGAPGRYLSFKLFPNHLTPALLRQVVLSNRGMAKILFRRNPLKTYISREKALQQGQWEFANTTGVRIRANAQAFVAYEQRVSRWYSSLRHYLKDTGQPFTEFTYEELMTQGSDFARLNWIVERLRTTFRLRDGLELSTDRELAVRRKKQDVTRSLADRIENFEEFANELRQLGMGHYLA